MEVAEADSLKKYLDRGYRAWINDAYWLVMPYKLKDSGVTLTYGGLAKMENGRDAYVLTLTFENVGVTPQNKYDVFVDRERMLVEQWAFYRNASDEKPRFVGPWTGWVPHGRILLSSGRGTRAHTGVAVFEELPRSVFESPRSRGHDGVRQSQVKNSHTDFTGWFLISHSIILKTMGRTKGPSFTKGLFSVSMDSPYTCNPEKGAGVLTCVVYLFML